MRCRQIFVWILVICVLCGINLSAAQEIERPVTGRYAFVVGTNYGGKDRIQLRYAASDAESILEVLEELGGVFHEDSLLLVEPDIKTFYTEIGRLQEKIEEARAEYNRIEVLFYYSGHSDEDHILLGDEKISYKDFREAINSMNADVRIAILDSCASGAFTRIKGGKRKLPFLMDTAYDMKGYAFMSSSSATEASQESDLIKGSFFTHYLISGLRGAADVSQDGRVTLNEAYRFAFNETLAETAKTVSGPQHPHYNIQMSGTGDVVMTDIRRSSAILILDEGLTGKIFIHDKSDQLIVELTKPFGRKIELGLEEGEYPIINIPEGGVLESWITIQEGKDFELSSESFAETDIEYTTPRGDRSVRIRKETFLGKKISSRFFGAVDTKSTSVFGEYALLMGGQIGLIFNRIFSISLGGYARAIAGNGALELDVEFDYGQPSYGGIIFGYTFSPRRKIHVNVNILAGSGDAWARSFYILEPEIDLILNLSRIVSMKGGLSFPITDKEYSGLENPILTIGFQFGI